MVCYLGDGGAESRSAKVGQPYDAERDDRPLVRANADMANVSRSSDRPITGNARIAQQDRARDFYSLGSGFDSWCALHNQLHRLLG